MTATQTPVVKPRRSFLNLADQTPASRDRYVDFLRAFSILVVVLGHWLVTVVYWKNGRLVGVNALEKIPALWLATWLLQVMPLFFFVGGFSNLVTLDSLNRKGGTYSGFVSTRAARLLKPTAIFLAVWIPISIVLDVFFNLNVRAFELSMKLLTAPLWFLGVYLIMIGMAPKMLKIHRRFGRGALATMALGAVVVDVLGIWLELPFIGALNYLFIWLFAHQLGFFYADGSLLRLGRKAFLAMAAGGLGGLVLLTQVADYSPNMVFNVHGRSNTNPPTVCILVLTIWQVGLAMLLRDPVSKVLARRKPWAGVIALNGLMMTMFLWHMTAAVIIAAAVYPLGFPGPEAGTPLWWALRPVWVAMLAGTLLVLVMVFGRYERGRPKREAASAPGSQPDTVRLPLTRGQQVATVLGLVYCILGFIGFATASFGGFASADGNALFGFTMNPLQSLIHLVVGWSLLNAGNAGARRARSAAWQAVALLAVLGLAGILFLGANPSFNVIAVNRAISVLHLLSAAGAAGALLVKRRVSVPA
ncbi:MAG TPA: acyltransferase family protein [Actinomycetota bacterium]|nr:acyltransferase family protein [Actinomycetota bacterium]